MGNATAPKCADAERRPGRARARASTSSSAGSTRPRVRRRRAPTSRTRATTSGGCSTTPGSRRGCSSRAEQFELLGTASAPTNAAFRTTPGSGDLRRADFAGSAERLERIARELRPRVDRRSSARRPTAARSASARARAADARSATSALRPSVDLARERRRPVRTSACVRSAELKAWPCRRRPAVRSTSAGGWREQRRRSRPEPGESARSRAASTLCGDGRTRLELAGS